MTMSIRDVTELVGGRLQFGSMPPLDGNRATVERILPSCQNVNPRDVVLWCDNQPAGDCFLEEAYVRGALGIIAQRPVTPWAGRFSLAVDDTQYVLRRLAWWKGKQVPGRRVLIIDPLSPSPTYHLLCQLLRQPTSEIDYAGQPESNDSVLWQIIGLDPESDNTLVHITELPASDDWCKHYKPEVVVLCEESALTADLSRREYFAPVAPRMISDAHVVMPVHMINEACEIGWHGPTTSYGFTDNCDVIGDRTADNALQAINGVVMKPVDRWRYVERSVLAAVAAARALGIPETEIIKRIEGQSRGDDRLRVAS